MLPSHAPDPEAKTCLPLHRGQPEPLYLDRGGHNQVATPILGLTPDLHFMPMQMPRMTRRAGIVDNDPHCLVSPQVVDIPIIVRSRIANVSTLC